MALTRREHLLIKLSEECIEVAKEISKTLLFGEHDIGPDSADTNIEKVEQELNDLIGTLDMLIDEGVLSRYDIFDPENMLLKQKKIEHWMKYSQEKGITEKPTYKWKMCPICTNNKAPSKTPDYSKSGTFYCKKCRKAYTIDAKTPNKNTYE